MARPAYSDKERKEIEAKIRAAALALFREVGYRGVTLRAVAKQLGWSAPALYRY
jgi:AcrR family transcriptional regulator